MNEKKKSKTRMPEWAPSNADMTYASRIVEGNKTQKNISSSSAKRGETSRKYDLDILVDGVLSCNRTTLSKAITLIESNSIRHIQHAQELIKRLIPYSGKSIRIGITGVPGAGKSTFIEAFGCSAIDQGHRVAVLAIDPSSTISKGSILGDKTRMEKLSRSQDSFIRPSPSSGILGGVARKTMETIIACEAAGYDVILIETVGVGQSEVTVRSLVDFFLLLQITGAGDELQGIKKGIIELADMIAINKADGDNLNKAELFKSELTRVLHFLQPVSEGWTPPVVTCSALHGTNIDHIWQIITDFRTHTNATGLFQKRRTAQKLEWFDSMLRDCIYNQFFNNEMFSQAYKQSRSAILDGTQTPAAAVTYLLELIKPTI